MDVLAGYDAAAAGYAEQLSAELDRKPLDRHLLNRFAEETAGRGRVADLGCGPGHVGAYLAARGVEVVGVDLSPRMIDEAARRHPGLAFQVGDMRALGLTTGGLVGVVAFYAIVHFDPDDLAAAVREVRRVLAPGGVLLLAFHLGDETVHLDSFFGAAVSLDFHFFPRETVAGALQAAGLRVTEAVEREPYPEAEHPSRRCYLFARAG